MYNHIAHALARGYIDLYYVNMDTGEFVDFHTDEKHGVLTEARRGKDFFETCTRESGKVLIMSRILIRTKLSVMSSLFKATYRLISSL